MSAEKRACIGRKIGYRHTILAGHLDTCPQIDVIYVVGKNKALPHGEVVPFFVCCSINFKVYNNYIKNNSCTGCYMIQ